MFYVISKEKLVTPIYLIKADSVDEAVRLAGVVDDTMLRVLFTDRQVGALMDSVSGMLKES